MPNTRQKEKMISKRQRIIRMNAALKELMDGKTIYRPQKNNTAYFDKAIEFIKFGAHPDTQNIDGETLLYQAVAVQNVEALKKLVQLPGIDLNKRVRPRGVMNTFKTRVQRAVDKILGLGGVPCTLCFKWEKGVSPVYFAAETGQLEMIDVLQAAGANLDVPNRFNQSALLAANRDLQTPVAEKLKAYGAHEIGKVPGQGVAVSLTGMLGRLEKTGKKAKDKMTGAFVRHEKEQEKPKAFVLTPAKTMKDKELQKALAEFNEQWAYIAPVGREKELQRHFTKCLNLIKQGANPNVNVPMDAVGRAKHYTLLHQAAASKHAGWVKEVLKVPGINPNACDEYGTRPIHIVAKRQHSGADIMKELCAVPDIDVNVQDEKGNTPMYYLVQGVGLSTKGGPLMSAKALWETGKVNLDVKNNIGESCRDLLTVVASDVADYLRKETHEKEVTVQEMVQMRANGNKINASR